MVGLVGIGARALACMLLLFDLVLLIKMCGLRTEDWPSGPICFYILIYIYIYIYIYYLINGVWLWGSSMNCIFVY
jgi:hypothetical protein